jgi:hypothetical protein
MIGTAGQTQAFAVTLLEEINMRDKFVLFVATDLVQRRRLLFVCFLRHGQYS